eukprot:TRINITY_DN1750_c0_g1_i25.p2 TRINITY_DN1750_c0_g1~~TRINITY_DN1750_c0_g1_i25.p2  ORF type:complete len:173 (+),score=36.18 TRINITY_DN1750_c0_g1_i25:1223-1741(+)
MCHFLRRVNFFSPFSLIVLLRRDDFLGILVLCFIDLLDAIYQYFNHYAYCEVAIYGKPFCVAASDTWLLLKNSCIAAIVNDNLIGSVLFLGALLTAVVTGGVGYLLAFFWGYDALTLFSVGIPIGLVMGLVTMQIVDSAVTCLFVCFADDPEILRDTCPGMWQRLMSSNLGN